MNRRVAELVPLVDFLGAALGASTEVVLHDLADPDHSVVKIVNGHVSGREVGAPATDFARALAVSYASSDVNFVSDYVCTTVDGRPLQGSTLFVRDGGAIVGMLCVNIDPQPFRDLEDALKVFMEAYRHGGSEEYRDTNLDEVRAAYKSSSVEVLSLSSEDEGVGQRVRQLLASVGKTPSELDQEGRLRVVSELDSQGVFRLKGATADVAAALHVSVPSVYRYLQRVRGRG